MVADPLDTDGGEAVRAQKAKPRKVRPRHEDHPLGKVGNWDIVCPG